MLPARLLVINRPYTPPPRRSLHECDAKKYHESRAALAPAQRLGEYKPPKHERDNRVDVRVCRNLRKRQLLYRIHICAVGHYRPEYDEIHKRARATTAKAHR